MYVALKFSIKELNSEKGYFSVSWWCGGGGSKSSKVCELFILKIQISAAMTLMPG